MGFNSGFKGLSDD